MKYIVHSQPWQFLNILINDASVVVNVGHWQCCFKAVARARRASPRRVLMCLGSLLTWYAAGTYLLRQQSRSASSNCCLVGKKSELEKKKADLDHHDFLSPLA